MAMTKQNGALSVLLCLVVFTMQVVTWKGVRNAGRDWFPAGV
jgi:hypothetical protein